MTAVRIINRNAFTVNGMYVIRTSGGWVKQIGVWSPAEIRAMFETIKTIENEYRDKGPIGRIAEAFGY